MSKHFKVVKDTDDVSEEFLKELCCFIELHQNKAQTKGDLLVLHCITRELYEILGFYNEDGEEIDIMNIFKAGGIDD